jgi:hypothetical protein
MAFTTRRPAAGVIFHSDRAVQAVHQQGPALAGANGVILSVSRKGNAGTTPSPRASSPRSSASSSTTGPGQPGPGGTGPSSTTSKADTTPGGSIPPSTISARPNTSRSTTTPPARRHDQLKKPVRQSGSSPDKGPGGAQQVTHEAARVATSRWPGLRTPHMKRPCQAFAGGRVVDHLMSVFRGCFCAWFTCPPGLPVPAGWVRAAAAGRAG